MSRTKPNCAHCGGSLRRRASISCSWDVLPGEPTVGWHAGPSSCWERDDLARGVMGSGAKTGATLVAEIERRGPERVQRVALPRRVVEAAAR